MDAWRDTLWGQFGAAIDMLARAIRACPADLWARGPKWQQFWYGAYHSVYYIDHYLSDSEVGFAPPPPFTDSESSPAGDYPARVYTQDEVLTYLAHGRAKCKTVLAALTAERASERCGFAMRDLTVAELLLYTLRHVQHHAGQLHLLLRQHTDDAPTWVGKAPDEL